MQLTMSMLAVITAGQGGLRLLFAAEMIADEIHDNQQGLLQALRDVSAQAAAAALAAVQIMAGASLLIVVWVR